MWFFSNFRTFSRLAREFEDRIGQLETKNAALRRDLAELDEFTHRISRKRYQETYIPPGAAQSTEEGAIVAPGANVAEIGPGGRIDAIKAAIRARLKAQGGRPA